MCSRANESAKDDWHLGSGRGDAPSPSISEPGRKTADSIFVWGMWAYLLLNMLILVARYGKRFPISDDWDIILYLSGAAPLGISWLWDSGSEHRLLLPKLLFWALYPPAGFDVRAGALSSTILMGLVCAGCLWTCRRLRGEMSDTDAFFPLLFFSFAHYTYYRAMYLHFVVVILLSCLILFAILRSSSGFSAGHAMLAGVCLCLLPLAGAQGLVMAPPLAFWLFSSGVLSYRSNASEDRRSGAIQIGLAGLSLVIVLLYFVGLTVSDKYLDKSIISNLKRSIVFVNIYFLNITLVRSRWLGLPIPMIAGLVALGAARGVLRDPDNRRRDIGMLCFGIAFALLALATARGRGSLLWFMPPHYAILTIPGLCWLYFAVQLYTPISARRLIQLVLLCITGLQFSLCYSGDSFLKNEHAIESAIDLDLKSGVTPERLVELHINHFTSEGFDRDSEFRKRQIISCLRSLRDRKIWPYSQLSPDREEARRPTPAR
jgi:hypothetical protein